MINIAVFGANGQLGQTIYSLVGEKNKGFRFFTSKEVDITQKKDLDDVFRANKFSYCINCAAYTNVEEAEKNKEKAFLVNSEGTKNVAEECKKHNVVLIQISTDYVFDGASKTPYKTTDLTNPINQYGKSKLQGEINISRIFKDYYIIRTSWLYSPFGKNFVKKIISKLKENAELKITTQEIGTPTSCIDLSKFIIHITEKKDVPYGIYNFSAKGSATWYLFALEIAKILSPNKISNITPTDNYKSLAKRPKYSVFNIEKTEQEYKELKSWQKSLQEVINEIKKADL
jgi:dTDP-4-dehydrorhamnose reductase